MKYSTFLGQLLSTDLRIYFVLILYFALKLKFNCLFLNDVKVTSFSPRIILLPRVLF